jgi:hypothetical protein
VSFVDHSHTSLTYPDIENEDQRKKVLHLILCLLPKAHRDTMEVLFRFLNWVSSFHTVDEESGNKMDTWNIATVMAPNILRESNDKEMRSVDQGAVKVVFDLIENNDEFSEVRVVSLPKPNSPLTTPGTSRDYGTTLRRQLVRHVCQRDYAAVGTARQEPRNDTCRGISKVPSRYSIQERPA